MNRMGAHYGALVKMIATMKVRPAGQPIQQREQAVDVLRLSGLGHPDDSHGGRSGCRLHVSL
ncbi:MAG TPA: hypothetical protein VF456_01720, partial [Vicinamibacterales bacterium]